VVRPRAGAVTLDPPNKGARTIVRNAPTDIVRDEIDETRRWPPRRAAPSMGRDESIRAAPTKSLLGLVDPPLPREAETLFEGKDVHLGIQRHFTLHLLGPQSIKGPLNSV